MISIQTMASKDSRLLLDDICSDSCFIRVKGCSDPLDSIHQRTGKPFLKHYNFSINDRTSLLNRIKLSGKQKNVWTTKTIHADVLKKDIMTKDVYIATALLTAYANCGALDEAEEMFEQLPRQDVVSWNALINGYIQYGLADPALKLYRQMQDEGVSPCPVTYACILKACGIIGSLDIGEAIDAEIRKLGLLEKDVVLGTALVDMYFKCGAVKKAEELFRHLPIKNVVSWTALLTGYIQNGLANEALKCFGKMQDSGVCPNAVTYVSALKACGMTRSLEIGEEIALEVRKRGLLQRNLVLGNTLVDMFAKCGALVKAKEVFDQFVIRDTVSWNVLIAGYVQHGFSNEAMKLFGQMQDTGVCPDVVTYICILKTCGILGSLEIGEDIDAEIRRKGLLHKHVVLGTALIDMYSKCGALEKAQEVFRKIPKWDVVSWNAMITAYSHHGLGDEALRCLKRMEDVGISPNLVTYICILKACGIVGSLEVGKNIDAEVRRQGLLHNDIFLGTALVDMYGKCGKIEKAQEVFEQLPVQNVVSWTSLIAGYAQLGKVQRVLTLYTKMRSKGVVPNLITFIVLLTACSHVGLLEEAEKLFDEMCIGYSLTPMLEHYACMIDIFGRAGYFHKAEALLNNVPASNHLQLFLGILGACQKWTNVTLGRWAFDHSIRLDQNCTVAYICMENIYTAAGMQTGL